ncbi:hypothetical protein AB0L14_30980 [Streptomyces sp. NPDC052727]|uniref:hypothetical protein n=1 Tax=Streptomyces sp. NPDC052727 TaxID=3154854 RepID=UPI00342FFBCB
MHAHPLFTGGPVLTPEGRTASAVAVTGDRISAVGHAGVRELAGPRAGVVDLAGRLLPPGPRTSRGRTS